MCTLWSTPLPWWSHLSLREHSTNLLLQTTVCQTRLFLLHVWFSDWNHHWCLPVCCHNGRNLIGPILLHQMEASISESNWNQLPGCRKSSGPSLHWPLVMVDTGISRKVSAHLCWLNACLKSMMHLHEFCSKDQICGFEMTSNAVWSPITINPIHEWISSILLSPSNHTWYIHCMKDLLFYFATVLSKLHWPWPLVSLGCNCSC